MADESFYSEIERRVLKDASLDQNLQVQPS